MHPQTGAVTANEAYGKRAASESYGEALSAISAMLAYAQGSAAWEDVLLRMAVFVTSAVPSKQPPPLAQMLAAGTGAGTLARRLAAIRQALRDADDITAAAQVAVQVAVQSWPSLSRMGERAWRRASAEALLLIRVCARLDDPVRALRQRVEAARAESFTEIDAGETAPVQVMNLHQTKGREADVVIIAFRSGRLPRRGRRAVPRCQQAPVRDTHARPEAGHAHLAH